MIKEKILVLGASGFIGLHLCEKLLDQGFNTIALVRNNGSENVKKLLKMGIEVDFIGDLFKKKKFKKNYCNINYVINLAALAHVSSKKSSFDNKNLNNLETNIIRNFSNKNLKIIHISSAKVSEKNKNYSQYAVIKKNGERLIRNFYKKHIILRPPLIYGPFVKANFLSLIKIVEKNYPLPFKSINNKRSYMYIDNLTDAIIYILKNQHFYGRTYYISDGCTLSTTKLIELIGSCLDKKVFLFRLPRYAFKVFFNLISKPDIFNKLLGDFKVSNKNFVADTRWKPPYHYKYGFKKTCLWYKRKFRM